MTNFLKQMVVLVGGKRDSTRNSFASTISSIHFNPAVITPDFLLPNIDLSNEIFEIDALEHLKSTWHLSTPTFERKAELEKEMERQLNEIAASEGDVIEYAVGTWMEGSISQMASYSLVQAGLVKNVLYRRRLARIRGGEFTKSEEERESEWTSLATFENSWDVDEVRAWVEQNHSSVRFRNCQPVRVIEKVEKEKRLSGLYDQLPISAGEIGKAETAESLEEKLQDSPELQRHLHLAIMSALGEPTVVIANTANKTIWRDKVSDRIKSFLATPTSRLHNSLSSSRCRDSNPMSQRVVVSKHDLKMTFFDDGSFVTDDDKTLIDEGSETKSLRSLETVETLGKVDGEWIVIEKRSSDVGTFFIE